MSAHSEKLRRLDTDADEGELVDLANETSTSKEPKMIGPDENYRLRHGLNVNIQIKIFDHLTVTDLLQLCVQSGYFLALITEQVFGKSMRKNKIAEDEEVFDLEHFLQLVKQYCAVGRLIDVELHFRGSIANINLCKTNAMNNLTKQKKLEC